MPLSDPVEHSDPPTNMSDHTVQREHERLQLATIFEQAPAAIATLRGPEHRFEMANPLYYQIVGYRDIIGKPVCEALPEVVEQGLIGLLDTVYRTGNPFVANQMPVVLQRGPGQSREEAILNFVYQPLFDYQGAVSGILVHAVEVTEWIRAQEQRAAAEVRYRNLVTMLPQVIYLLDTRGVVMEVNAAGEQLLLRSNDAIVGHHCREFIVPEDFEPTIQMFAQVLSGISDNIELELHVIRSSGERRLVHITATALKTNGQITGLSGIGRDITEERARDERMQLLGMALEQIEQGVTLMDKDMLFRFANPAAKKILGIAADNDEIYHVDQFIPDANARRELNHILAKLRETGQWSGRVRRRRLSDGQVLLLDMMKGEVAGADGHPLYFNLFQDASKAIEREQQLRRAERLASLGTLIGGVAHELNNPLTAIISLCELMLLQPRSSEEREDLETIFHEAERMARIVADLRTTARHTQEYERPKGPVDLNAVVRHILKIRAYTLQTSNIVVQDQLADNLPTVYGDRGQLEQVLLNLIVNAEQAMNNHEHEGRLIVSTSETRTGVRLQVIDNGHGIGSEYMDRLFDPFFTTKAPGEGIGLGLSLVHSIIEEHGGTIHVDSTVGKGTAFRIDLRVISSNDVTAPLVVMPPVVAALRILIVDDEPPIRDGLARFLRRRGHHVDVASEGQDALRKLDKDRYDCVLSDLRMPGMGGEQLLSELRQRHRRERVIFLTGDAASQEVARVIAQTDVEVLLKPIAPSEAARVIEER